MNCEVCGTELPFGAMFCGECGRAVGTRAAAVRHPDSGMPVPQPLHRGNPTGQRDTVILEPVVVPEPASVPEALEGPEVEPVPEALEGPEVEPVPEALEGPEVEPVPAPVPEALEGPEVERASTPVPEALEGPEVELAPAPVPEALEGPEVEQDLDPQIVSEDVASEAELDPEPAPTPASEPESAPSWLLASENLEPPPAIQRPDPFPWGDRGSAIFLDSDELEQTLITQRRDLGERFILQFSTGESVTVFGTGLLGRNPVPQPGEYFDQLVAITDPGKSVSKTHLEFGQESGSFWVSDRYSGNGSVVREPETAPRRLVAGRRYRIVRGSRVDIGEQFFVVS